MRTRPVHVLQNRNFCTNNFTYIRVKLQYYILPNYLRKFEFLILRRESPLTSDSVSENHIYSSLSVMLVFFIIQVSCPSWLHNNFSYVFSACNADRIIQA